LIESTFSAVMNIIHNLQNPNIIEKYLKLFVNEAKLSETLPPQKKENLMNGILSTIQACVLGLQGKIDSNLAQEIYQLVIQIFQNDTKINSQGLHIISALAISIGPEFKKFLPSFSPYLILALNNINEPDILKAAIGNISDICRVCEHEFEGFLTQILPSLLTSLSNHNFDKHIKLNIFSCIGDISLGSPKVLIPYFENVLSIYDSAFQAAISISKSV
jgi:importin subunit beta-1